MDTSITQKVCRTCQKIKSYAEFSRNNEAKDGYCGICKACMEAKREQKKAEKQERLARERLLNKQEKIKIITKSCKACGQEKPLEDFLRDQGKRYTERHPRCRECERFAAKQRAQIRREEAELERIEASLALAWEERIAQKSKRQYENSIKRSYGVTPERYAEMIREQHGQCAICGATQSYATRPCLVVDHSHVTGAIRGLLCAHCNMGLGFFRDKLESLEKAIEYLRKNQWD